MSENFEEEINAVYEEMMTELITSVNKDRVKALAKVKVIVNKYNEVLTINRDLNKELISTQKELSHKLSELEKLKKRTPKNAKSKDISE